MVDGFASKVFVPIGKRGSVGDKYKVCADTTQFGHFFADHILTILGWKTAGSSYVKIYKWESTNFSMGDLVWIVLFYNHLKVGDIPFMVRQLKKEGSLGIKPSWAFMFSTTLRKIGRGPYEVLTKREIGHDNKIHGGIYLNSLILLTKSLAPIHNQRLIDLPLASSLLLRFDHSTRGS